MQAREKYFLGRPAGLSTMRFRYRSISQHAFMLALDAAHK
jgi:hypothetical protein